MIEAATEHASPRVLIVEDETMVRMALIEELQSLGFDVEEAGSAAEALAKVDGAAGPIQAAIIDYNLPDRKGDALTAELRAMLPDLPVVIVSAYRHDMLSAFFDHDSQVRFLGKPYRVQELVPLLHVMGIDPGVAH